MSTFGFFKTEKYLNLDYYWGYLKAALSGKKKKPSVRKSLKNFFEFPCGAEG